MTEQEQIEEMATAISNYADKYDWELFEFECENLAIVLHNLGYRKLPDGATVLLVGKYNQALDEKTIEYFVKHNEQIRKETAEKILNSLLFEVKALDDYESVGKFDILGWLEELAKKYGVEVEK